MNFEKQEGIKRKLINNTLRIGKKILKKENLNLREKALNFIYIHLWDKLYLVKQFHSDLLYQSLFPISISLLNNIKGN